MKCRNCGGPFSSTHTKCEYCGAKNEIDLKGISYVDISDSVDADCPRCKQRLEVIQLKVGEGVSIERCAGCHGMFFNPGELEYVLTHSVSNVSKLNADHLNSVVEGFDLGKTDNRYLKCPVCSELMTFKNYSKGSGVIVDWCKAHGIWLDGGELRKLCEWRKAGGQIIAERERENIYKNLSYDNHSPDGSQPYVDTERNRNTRRPKFGSNSGEKRSDSLFLDFLVDTISEIFD